MDNESIQLWKREKFLILGWDALGECLNRIKQQIDRSGFVPTTIVGISRGGLVLASHLANAFGLRDLQVISIVRNTSEEKYSSRKEPKLQWMAPDSSLEGKHLLVADDIAGDGGTLTFALGLLEKRRPASVRTAVVVKNQNSRFIPDYQAIEVSDWIVFPWEPRVNKEAQTEVIKSKFSTDNV